MPSYRLCSALLCVVAGAAACAPRSAPSVAPAPVPTAVTVPVATPAAIARARADSARLPWTAADVAFMTGMIGHHAQAIVMARLAPTRAADAGVLRLAERIIAAQQDEIAIMQQWLRVRGQPVPDPAAAVAAHGAHAGHDMANMPGMTMMPGMLSPQQLAALGAAKGPAFDALFLRLMIQHHTGATAMVTTLFATPGAGQDEAVFKFASDVNVDQTTEIARMRRMLFLLEIQK